MGSRGGKFVDGIADNFVNISLSRPAPDSPLHTIIASEEVYLDCNASTVSDISQQKDKEKDCLAKKLFPQN